ncbi:hypothetical protein LSAT2_018012, partial [Lamellibrachia satsuma]
MISTLKQALAATSTEPTRLYEPVTPSQIASRQQHRGLQPPSAASTLAPAGRKITDNLLADRAPRLCSEELRPIRSRFHKHT